MISNKDELICMIHYFSKIYGVDDPEVDDDLRPDLSNFTAQELKAYRYGFRSCARLILWELRDGQ